MQKQIETRIKLILIISQNTLSKSSISLTWIGYLVYLPVRFFLHSLELLPVFSLTFCASGIASVTSAISKTIHPKLDSSASTPLKKYLFKVVNKGIKITYRDIFCFQGVQKETIGIKWAYF